jgi:cytochrome P450
VSELVQNRGVLHRLTREVRGAFVSESDINIASTGTLQYLNAVINEALRLDPPTTIGVPRVVPRDGDTICGKWVPGGVSTIAIWWLNSNGVCRRT